MIENRSKQLVSAASLAVLALALAGCGTDGEVRATAAPVLHGVASTNAAVVAVLNPQELCTGYLIAPNLVLTARHCVSTVGGPGTTTACSAMTSGGMTLTPATPVMDYAVTELSVFTQQTLPFDGTTGALSVAEVIVLPDSAGMSLCGRDVALVRLTHPLVGAVVIAPRLDSPPVVGELVTVVGYGQTGGGDPNTAGARLETRGSSPVAVGTTIESGVTRTVDGEWVLDTGPCSGDSGSPAIDAHGLSIGVMVRGHGAVCTSMVYERVDVHADWLVASARAAAQAASMGPPSWTSPAVDAGVDAGVALGDASADASPEAGAVMAPHAGCSCRVSGAGDTRGTASLVAGLALVMLTFGIRLRRRRTVEASA